jgi:hypothetical protein
MSDDWYTPISIKERNKQTVWAQLHKRYTDTYDKRLSQKHRWIFRGEKKFNKDEEQKYLRTSLESAFDLYGIRTDKKKTKCEMKIIRKFQRKASLYIKGREPDTDDILEWLALMRHHGAPTRLMDWNYSYYIAIYFALAENENGVVWALNTTKMSNAKFVIDRIPKKGHVRFSKLRRRLKRRDDILGIRGMNDKLDDLAIACYLIEDPFKNRLPLVYPVNPFRLNRRLTIQHGLFLLTGDIGKSFKENLKNCVGKPQLHKITIECNKQERNEILRQLKNMNISNDVLFQDLDGFAKSTEEMLAYPEMS